MDVAKFIEHTLLNVGISPALSGFDYARDLILAVLDNPGVSTIELYDIVGKKHFDFLPRGIRGSRIERCVRRAIEQSCWKADYEYLNYIFGNVASPDSGKLTNSQFIHCMARHLKECLRAEHEPEDTLAGVKECIKLLSHAVERLTVNTYTVQGESAANEVLVILRKINDKVGGV